MSKSGLTLKDHYAASMVPLKLHLGCGGMRWLDFLNIDFYPIEVDKPDSSRSGCVADIFADMRDLGLPDGSISEIFTSHTIDHFTRWEAIAMLKDWYRMLTPGGKLVIEAADFVRCVLWLFHPLKSRRHLARSQFYGNQWDNLDYQTHRYLWSARELSSVLKDVGFARVRWHHATLTHYPGRDMQLTAIKSRS